MNIEAIETEAIASVDPGGPIEIIVEAIDAEAINTVDPGGRSTIIIEAVDDQHRGDQCKGN